MENSILKVLATKHLLMKPIYKLLFLSSLLMASLNSCKNDEGGGIVKIQAIDNIPDQQYTINADADTVLKGSSGTVLRIYKGTFTDRKGATAKGSINVTLKEAIRPADITMAGLSTTSNGKILKTGGMIYLNATANGEMLTIGKSKFVGVLMPAKVVDNSMQLFKGEPDSAGCINWVSPEPILNDQLKADATRPGKLTDTAKLVSKTNTDTGEIDAILAYVDSDSAGTETGAGGVRQANRKNKAPLDWNTMFQKEVKGTNFFNQDPGSSYIFELKGLGWANIDVLANDPNTKEVNLTIALKNWKRYPNVYSTLVVSGSYLPGYQKADNTYCFSHGDDEQMALPVGASATLIFTAYRRDGKVYYAVKKFTIAEQQRIEVEMTEVSQEELKKILNAAL